MGTRNRWLLLAMIITLAGAAGSAFAFAGGDAPAVLTAKDVYADDMPLKEVSRLSQSKPGEVAPPCPAEESVTKLKESGLVVGPCDPVPENGALLIVPRAGQIKPDSDSNDAVCAAVETFGLDPVRMLRLPCAQGSKVVSTRYPVIDGETCVEVAYVPNAEAKAVTETLCPSSPASSTGAVLEGPEDSHSHSAEEGVAR